jgi:hypothetical protein
MRHRSITALGAVLLCLFGVSGAAAAPEGTLTFLSPYEDLRLKRP